MLRRRRALPGPRPWIAAMTASTGTESAIRPRMIGSRSDSVYARPSFTRTSTSLPSWSLLAPSTIPVVVVPPSVQVPVHT